MEKRNRIHWAAATATILMLLILVICFFWPSWEQIAQYKHSLGLSLTSQHETQAKRVLVTGAAGFVGFHVARQLAVNPLNFVVGMDNFNDYYDVQLKIDRAYELHKMGVQIHHADLCDVKFLQQLFRQSNFTHVVHLGAQAGVRYSLENPLAYVHSNLEGTQAILDVIKLYPHTHLTYASSSSVYGKDSPIPFRLTANTDRPGNMYAATKRANELMSYQHCTATGVKSVGLRFFTVYGPWGRPDMAVYKFAESILDGKKVPMFKVSGDKELGRDFTYIDDITSGVLSTMDYKTDDCGVVFNLGFGHPVSVPRLILMMEEELGMPAELDDLPLPPTEILQTWADIDVSRHHLGFNPKTDLRTGVKKFAEWFHGYRKLRADIKKSGKASPATEWYDKLPKHQANKDGVTLPTKPLNTT